MAELINRTNNTKLWTKRDVDMENFDLIAKVKELLNKHNLWGPDGTYTFKDGERWAHVEEHDDAITSD